MGENSKIESTILAYLAGMIDADGYITIQRSVRKGKVYFGAGVGISGTRRQPHDLAASLWGGVVSEYQPKNPIHRSQFQWSRVGETAIVVIEDIYPYLLIKKEQADVAKKLQEHIRFGKGYDPYPWFGPDYDPSIESNNLKIEMINLNQSRRRVRSVSTLNIMDGIEYKEFWS